MDLMNFTESTQKGRMKGKNAASKCDKYIAEILFTGHKYVKTEISNFSAEMLPFIIRL
jgi:hypothetical protein